MRFILERPFSRRAVIVAIPAVLFGSSARAAAETIGEAVDVRGKVVARQVQDVRGLAKGAALMLQDRVETAEKSFARLELAGRTTVRLGSKARLLIDRFVAEVGGVLELGEGAMLLDRSDKLPKLDITIRSQFALIAVRGTRFFAGPSKGVFGVFVVRGVVEVEAAGVTRRLRRGEGVDIANPGDPPGEVARWKKPRIDAALKSVGL
jgi:ferric-dicitrate binding protein FerR (iron transport regulator)